MIFVQPFQTVFDDDVRAKFRSNIVYDSCATLTLDIQTPTARVRFCPKESIYCFLPPHSIAHLWVNTGRLLSNKTINPVCYSTCSNTTCCRRPLRNRLFTPAVMRSTAFPCSRRVTITPVLQGKPYGHDRFALKFRGEIQVRRRAVRSDRRCRGDRGPHVEHRVSHSSLLQ